MPGVTLLTTALSSTAAGTICSQKVGVVAVRNRKSSFGLDATTSVHFVASTASILWVVELEQQDHAASCATRVTHFMLQHTAPDEQRAP